MRINSSTRPEKKPGVSSRQYPENPKQTALLCSRNQSAVGSFSFACHRSDGCLISSFLGRSRIGTGQMCKALFPSSWVSNQLMKALPPWFCKMKPNKESHKESWGASIHAPQLNYHFCILLRITQWINWCNSCRGWSNYKQKMKSMNIKIVHCREWWDVRPWEWKRSRTGP